MSKLLEELQYKLQKNRENFFDIHGGLHDSQVLSISINLNKRYVSLLVDDFYANFRGLEGYRSFKKACVTFYVSEIVECDIDHIEQDLHIYEIKVQRENVKILFSPSGSIEMISENIVLSRK